MPFRGLLLAAILATLAAPALAQAPIGWSPAGPKTADYVFGTDRTRPLDRFTGGRFETFGPDGERLQRSAFIRSGPGAPSTGFATLMQTVSAERYRGRRVRLSAMLRTRDADRAQLWMRVDGENRRVLAFDSMSSRPVTGTRNWRRYSIVLEVPRNATAISYGFLLGGHGTVWADNVRLQRVEASLPATVGTPQSRAPTAVAGGIPAQRK